MSETPVARPGPSPGTDGRGVAIVAAAVASVLALLALAAVKLRSGIDPPSLFLDDQWVGIVLRDMGVAERFRLHLPLPIGFTLLAGAPGLVVHDAEVALQVVPALAYLTSAALFAVLVHRIARDPLVTVLGAAMILSSPLVADLAVRAKQYTLDHLVTVAVLLVMTELLPAVTPRRLVGAIAVLLVALAFSFVSVFLSVPVVLVACVVALRSEDLDRRGRATVALAGAAFLAAVAAYWVVELRGGSRPIMVEFWGGFFPSITDWAGARLFVADRLFTFLRQALPAHLQAFLLLAPPGVVWLWRSGRRPALAALLLFYGAVIAANVARAYPIGTGRTDVFAFPVTTLLVCLGVAFAVRAMPRRAVGAALAVGAIALFTVAEATSRGAVYDPPTDDGAVVRWVEERLGPEDGLVLSPYGIYAYAFYTDEPVRVVPADYFGHGFDLLPERPGTMRTSIGRWGLDDTEVVQNEIGRLVDFLRVGYPRIVYLETNARGPGRDIVRSIVASRGGYRLVDGTAFGGAAEAYLFERVGPG